MPVCLRSQRNSTWHCLWDQWPNVPAKRHWKEMRKRKFSHQNKVEPHNCFLNLFIIKTRSKKCQQWQQQSSKSIAHFFLSSIPKINSKTQSKAIWMMLFFLRLGGSIRRKQIKRPSHAYSKRKKRTPHFSLTSVTDLWGERDCLLSNAEVNTSTHTQPCGGRAVLGFKRSCTVFTEPPVSFPGWEVQLILHPRNNPCKKQLYWE